MIRRLYNWTLSLAERPAALWWLAAIAFVESSIFPIPPDALIIPMVLAVRQRAWLIAGVCTVASVLGALAGYSLGFFAFDAIGQPLISFYGYEEQFERFREGFVEWGVWAVAFFGLTPFPFKVITITSGFVHLDVVSFVLASIVSRGIRFFLVAGLLWKFGDPIREFIEKRLEWVVLGACGLIVLGFVALKYL
jgi:membrane protein YqaA with SNARE-associated domain